jgi:hypothetical protein
MTSIHRSLAWNCRWPSSRLKLARMPIPTVGWLAYGKDTEGNIFGMMHADANAK